MSDYAIKALIESTWSTRELMHWALNWDTTSPEIVRGVKYARPVWENVIAETRSASREFFEQLAAEGEDEMLRYNAAEALVAGGWTLSAINHRKS